MRNRLLLAGSLSVLLALGGQARAQTGAGVSGQQNGQPSANQNQPQMQTNNAQQPPNATTEPATPSAQNQPNPQPQLAK